MRVCVRACVRVCESVCVCVCLRECVCVCVSDYVIQLCQEIKTKRVTWIIITGEDLDQGP